MNLVELIRLSNHLSEMTVTDLQQTTSERAALIMHQADVPLAGVNESFRLRLLEKNLILQESFKAFEQEIAALKHEVTRHIEEQGNVWLQRSYRWYEKQLTEKSAQSPDAVSFHRNKPTRIDPGVANMLKSRVASQCGWKHPGMIIHPMQEPFMQEMVGADPLYVIDESYYLLEPSMQQYNQSYQYRLRPYVIEESFDDPILNRLPDQQIGFCLAYNYFNYKPFEMIKKYIEEIYQKLLPGGVLAFTFNDCDRYQAMESVEQNTTSYTPGTLIRGWAKYIGFEETFCYDDDGAWSWIEFRKPGQLTSLRGGQSLAKILPKPVAKSK
jgi:hypothetical protein